MIFGVLGVDLAAASEPIVISQMGMTLHGSLEASAHGQISMVCNGRASDR